MRCCTGLAKKYLVLVNLLVLIVSLGLIGFGSYLWIDLGDLAAGLNDYAVLSPIIVGVFLLLATILGYCGIKQGSKCMLLVYFLMILLVTVILASAGFVMLMLAGIIPSTGFEGAVEDFQESIYNECCVIPGFSTDLVPDCDDVSANQTSCIDQTFDIPAEVCSLLEEVTLNGVPVIGNTTEGGCGGGLGVDAFLDQIKGYLTDNFELIGGIELGVTGLMILILLASCVLFCSNREDFASGGHGSKPVHKAGEYSARQLA